MSTGKRKSEIVLEGAGKINANIAPEIAPEAPSVLNEGSRHAMHTSGSDEIKQTAKVNRNERFQTDDLLEWNRKEIERNSVENQMKPIMMHESAGKQGKIAPLLHHTIGL